jgi:hypothetical protein
MRLARGNKSQRRHQTSPLWPTRPGDPEATSGNLRSEERLILALELAFSLPWAVFVFRSYWFQRSVSFFNRETGQVARLAHKFNVVQNW